MQQNPNDPKPKTNDDEKLARLVTEAQEAMDLADAGATILAEAMRMAMEDEEH